MRVLSIFVIIVVGLFSHTTALATNAAPATSGIIIQVKQGDWGGAQVSDIQAVLEAVAETLAPYFPQHVSNRVVVASSTEGPRVLFKKSPEGAYMVLLNVQGRRWDQFSYQFSHELCHIFTNYDKREIDASTGNRDYQWFEEALCEMVSMFTLNRMALRWEQSPYPHWKEYAPAFRNYANRLLSERHRHLSPTETIAGWYGRHRIQLENNPYNRDLNELVATQLFALLDALPDGDGMEAVGYLNLASTTASQASFEAYLASWYSCCPEEKRNFVTEVISLFGKTARDENTSRSLAVSYNQIH